jgi:DNA relaxase NicK
MTYSVTMDWLSFTLHGQSKEIEHVLAYINPSGIMEAIAPRFGYDRASKTNEGSIIYTSVSNSRMGVHVIVPGSALSQMRESGTGGLALLQKVVNAKGKITRLDLAKDAQDEKFELMQFAQTVEAGMFSGTAQKASSVRSSDGGLTVYIGSRQSERFIRVYDKGVESGQLGDWVRLEMETKGEVSNIIARALAAGTVDLNSVICSGVMRMCKTDLECWIKILASDADWAAPKVEKHSDTEAWINRQVGQAILNHLDKNPDSPAVRRLYEVLKSRLG